MARDRRLPFADRFLSAAFDYFQMKMSRHAASFLHYFYFVSRNLKLAHGRHFLRKLPVGQGIHFTAVIIMPFRAHIISAAE